MQLMPVDRRWNWIDGGLLTYALAVMRGLWVWLLLHLWSQGVVAGRADLLSPLAVFGLLAGGTLAAQLGVYRIKSSRRATLLVVLGGLAALFLVLYLRFGAGRLALWQLAWLVVAARTPGLVLAVLVPGAWLWWWGILAGREPPAYDTYAGNFALGLMALAGAAAIAYAGHVVPTQGVLLTLLLFFAVGLATMAIASVQGTRRFERQRSDQSFALNRYWIGTVGAVIGGLVFAGLLLAQVFAPVAITRLLSLLVLVVDLLSRLLLWMVVALAYIVFGVFGLLARAFNIKPQAIEFPSIMVPDVSQQFKDLQNQPVGVSPGVYLVFRIAGAALALAIIVFVFALAFRRFRTYVEEDVEETRESILSALLLKEQLARLFRRRRAGEARPDPFVPVSGDDPGAQIRRIYQALLAWAVAQGVSRQPGLTPSEYGLLIADRLKAPAEAVNVVTTAYLKARYGNETSVAATVHDVAQAWAIIEAGDGQDVGEPNAGEGLVWRSQEGRHD